MPVPKRAVTSVLCIVALAVALWIGLGSSSTSAPHGVSVCVDPQNSPSSPSQASSTSEREPIPEGVEILVVDQEFAAPIEGAQIWCDVPDARLPFNSNSASCLGSTDQHGRLRVDREPTKSRILVTKSGYLSAGVDCGGEVLHKVVLSRGEVLEVRFVESYTERPLEGVWLFASSATFSGVGDHALEHLELVAQPTVEPERHPIHIGRSGSNGLARIEGIGRCSPFWRVSLPGYVLVDGPGLKPPDNEAIECPGRSYRLVLAPLVVAGIQVIGDHIVSSRGQPSKNFLMPIGSSGIERARELLESLFPDVILYVMAMRDPTVPLTCSVTLQLAKYGQHNVDLTFCRLEEFLKTGPQLLDVRREASQDANHRAVSIVVEFVNGNGELLRGERFLLLTDAGQILRRGVSGETMQLLPGTYHVEPSRKTIENSLPEPREISVRASPSRNGAENERPVRLELPLSRTLYPVTVSRQNHVQVASGEMLLRHSNGGRMVLEFDSSGRARLLLPEGRAEVLAGGGVSADDVVVEFAIPLETGDEIRLTGQ